MNHTGRMEASIRYFILLSYTLVWSTLLLVPDRFLQVDIPHQIGEGILPVDKLVHALGYFLLTVFMILALGTPPSSLPWTWLIAAAAAHGGLTEFLQTFVPGRDGDWLDWVVDVHGILAGAGFVGVCRWFLRRGSREAKQIREL